MTYHGALGLLLRVLGLLQAVVNLGLEGVDDRLEAALVVHGLGVDDLHLVDSGASIRELGVKLALGPVSGIQESPGLLDLAAESVGLPFRDANGLHDLLALAGLLLIAL